VSEQRGTVLLWPTWALRGFDIGLDLFFYVQIEMWFCSLFSGSVWFDLISRFTVFRLVPRLRQRLRVCISRRLCSESMTLVPREQILGTNTESDSSDLSYDTLRVVVYDCRARG